MLFHSVSRKTQNDRAWRTASVGHLSNDRTGSIFKKMKLPVGYRGPDKRLSVTKPMASACSAPIGPGPGGKTLINIIRDNGPLPNGRLAASDEIAIVYRTRTLNACIII